MYRCRIRRMIERDLVSFHVILGLHVQTRSNRCLKHIEFLSIVLKNVSSNLHVSAHFSKPLEVFKSNMDDLNCEISVRCNIDISDNDDKIVSFNLFKSLTVSSVTK